MASKRKRSPYSGALATPIRRTLPPPFWGAVTTERLTKYQKSLAQHELKELRAIKRKLSQKFFLLFDHYAIKDKKDTKALAWALASQHVEGYRVLEPLIKSKRGAKLQWGGDRLEDLLTTVEVIQEQHPNFDDRRALQFIVKNPELAALWGPSKRSGSTTKWIETLESRLQAAKRNRRLFEQYEKEHEKDLQQIAEKFRK